MTVMNTAGVTPHEETIHSYYAILLHTLRLCVHPWSPAEGTGEVGI